MPDTKMFYTNGQSIKNITLPQYPDAAWNFITEEPDQHTDDLYSRVAAVFRAINLSADTLASVPFALVKGKQDYDTSEDWQNKVGFMKNPSELFRLWRMSLFMTNSAYGFMEGNKVIKDLRYIVANTITPIVNSKDGLVGFKRTIGNQSIEYSLKDNKILWLWRRDYTTELLPSKHTEFKALMSAAGVINYADYYVQQFFQRGGIKPSILMVKGMPNATERERIESTWDKIIHGWYKYLGKVFSGDNMQVEQIGEGIDNMKDSSLHQEKLADIAMAAGMPLSLLLANSANYATAKVEYLSWFRNSIVPWCSFMADSLNDVLFDPLGLRLEFRPEMSQEGQEEEVERATAYHSYILSGMKPSIAAQIVGIDLPADVEFDDLDPEEKEPEEEAQPSTDIVEQQRQEEQRDMERESAPMRFTPSFKQMQELNLWHDIAKHKLKRNDPMGFDFTSTLPFEIHNSIAIKVYDATTPEELEKAFDLTDVQPDEDKRSEIYQLVNALNNAVEVIQ